MFLLAKHEQYLAINSEERQYYMDEKSLHELQQLVLGKSNPIMPHLVIGKVTNIDGL